MGGVYQCLVSGGPRGSAGLMPSRPALSLRGTRAVDSRKIMERLGWGETASE